MIVEGNEPTEYALKTITDEFREIGKNFVRREFVEGLRLFFSPITKIWSFLRPKRTTLASRNGGGPTASL